MRGLCHTLIVIVSLIGLAGAAGAQELTPVSYIHTSSDAGPYMWAIGGHEIVNVKASSGRLNPFMRAALYDERMVEILSRTQFPRLRASDIRAISVNGRNMVVIRGYLLMDVLDQDARVEGVSKSVLADRWARSVKRALRAIAPKPGSFGV